MFELIVDGEKINEAIYVKPLIEDLTYIAQGQGFEEVTIRMVKE